MTRRVVLLVTSPRLPAGLLTAQAWDLVRAHPVLAAAESDLVDALRAAGAAVRIVAEPTAEILLAAASPSRRAEAAPAALPSRQAELEGGAEPSGEAAPAALPSRQAELEGGAEPTGEAVAVWLAGPAGDERLARELGLRLAQEPGLAELELMYGSWDPPGARLLDAVAVTDRLRAEDPWKREQTHRTLARYLLEEAYEAYDSILSEDHEALRGEMGDVLLQVLLHARLAEELGEDERWNIDDVAGDFVAKMVRRNPHVFSDVSVRDAAEVVENWERIKREEGPGGITWSLPALVLATKLLSKLKKAPSEDDQTLGGRILRLIAADEPGVDAEASLRQALQRYAG